MMENKTPIPGVIYYQYKRLWKYQLLPINMATFL